jgi:uncharacterized protein
MSDTLVEEILVVLKSRGEAPYRWLREMRLSFQEKCELVELDEIPEVVRDQKDNHVLAAAMAGGCSVIVTGDRDLLELNPYEGVEIVTPKEFLDSLAM